MQSRICFPIAAGKMERVCFFFLTSYLAEISFNRSYRTYSFKNQYWNSISPHGGGIKSKLEEVKTFNMKEKMIDWCY